MTWELVKTTVPKVVEILRRLLACEAFSRHGLVLWPAGGGAARLRGQRHHSRRSGGAVLCQWSHRVPLEGGVPVSPTWSLRLSLTSSPCSLASVGLGPHPQNRKHNTTLKTTQEGSLIWRTTSQLLPHPITASCKDPPRPMNLYQSYVSCGQYCWQAKRTWIFYKHSLHRVYVHTCGPTIDNTGCGSYHLQTLNLPYTDPEARHRNQ